MTYWTEAVRAGLKEGRDMKLLVPKEYMTFLSNRLYDIAANKRFRASPRGKEALRMIGKGEASTLRFGEEGLMEAMREAVKDHKI